MQRVGASDCDRGRMAFAYRSYRTCEVQNRVGVTGEVLEFVVAGWSLQRGFPRVGAGVVHGGLR